MPGPDEFRLADIQGSPPGDDLLLIDRLGEHRCSSPTSTRSRTQRRGRLGDHQGNKQNLVLVLDHAGNNEGAHNVAPAPG